MYPVGYGLGWDLSNLLNAKNCLVKKKKKENRKFKQNEIDKYCFRLRFPIRT